MVTNTHACLCGALISTVCRAHRTADAHAGSLPATLAPDCPWSRVNSATHAGRAQVDVVSANCSDQISRFDTEVGKLRMQTRITPQKCGRLPSAGIALTLQGTATRERLRQAFKSGGEADAD